MKIKKYYEHDMNTLDFKQFINIAGFILLSLFVSIEFDKIVKELIEYGYCDSYGTFFDYLIYFFRGTYAYELSASSYFVLPSYWFFFHSFLSYTIGFYPYEDFIQYGKLSVLYGKDRVGWWIAKILWQISLIMFNYIIVYGTIAGYTMYKHQEMLLSLTKDIWNNFSPEILGTSKFEIIIGIVVLPILTSITISIIQETLSFLSSPIISFLFVNTVFIISVYSKSYIWITNFTMWLRSSWVYDDGINSICAVFIDLILIILFLKIGIETFKKIDIIDKGKIFE